MTYPNGLRIYVYRDDGNWGNYRAWYNRPDRHLAELFVASITLAHYEGEDEPCYTFREWERKAASLKSQYPDCVFIY